MSGSYLDRVADCDAQPLWIESERYVPRAPSPNYDAHLWKYDVLRPLLMESAQVVSPEESGRRVLVLRNPALPEFGGTTRSLYACLQLLLPGETAPEHRHTQSAFRLILEGNGAYTTVNGRRVRMEPGDFVLTPSWTWHGHGHDGTQPTVWLDGLDNGLMAQLDTTFFEPGPPDKRPESDTGGTSPFAWPYREARAGLAAVWESLDIDPCLGARRVYGGDAYSASVSPTMTASLSLFGAGFRGRSYRCTEGAVYCVLEGEGRTVIGETELDWVPLDIFVVPGWAEHSFHVETEAVLFRFSDEAVQRRLGVWREWRGD